MAKPYAEIFAIELDCWCHGLKTVTAEIDSHVLHQVVKQFAPVMQESILSLYAFDVIEVTQRFLAASRCRIPERELAFHILSLLPSPSGLDAEQLAVLTAIVDQTEKKFSGAVQRLEKKWNRPLHPIPPKLPGTNLIFPPKNGNV